MKSDADILQRVRQAFAGCRRPVHFTNFTHCEECAEHNEVLRAHDTQTLGIDQVGTIGWDPICFITAEGFAYYFPALARLALAEPDHAHGWYGNQLLFHLCLDGYRNERWQTCSPEQRRTVVEFLYHLMATRGSLVEKECVTESLLEAIEAWADLTPSENTQ